MHDLLDTWSFDPTVVLVAVVVAVHEAGLARLRRHSLPARTRRRRRRAWLFYAGLALFLLAVTSPVDHWGYDYFYVHMVGHIFVSFFAPLLIVAGAPWLPLLHGVPVGLRRRLGRVVYLGRWSGPLRAVGRFVVNPWTAVLSFNAAMVAWHLPALFDLSQDNRSVHVWLLHGTFLVTGVLFWLQIVPSRPYRIRTTALWQIGAIVGTNAVMFVLAMSLSVLSAHSWYPVYDHVPGVTMSPFADQQLGAAILWVCGDFWAVPALYFVIRRGMDNDDFVGAVDRLLHRESGPSVEDFRRPSLG